MNHPQLDKVITLLASNISEADLLLDKTLSSLGITKPEMITLIGEARRVLLHREYDQDEQRNIAIARLNDLYTQAVKTGNTKVALEAQTELTKLLEETYKGKKVPHNTFLTGSVKRMEHKLILADLISWRAFYYTLAEIGVKLHEKYPNHYRKPVSPQNVSHMFAKCLKNKIDENVATLRTQQLQQLQIMAKAIESQIVSGDPEAIKTAIKIQERLSRLMGLDTQIDKVEISGGYKIWSSEMDKLIDDSDRPN